MKEFKLTNPANVTACLKYIEELPLDPAQLVEIRPLKENLSSLQRKYYFWIIGIIAHERGVTKDDQHLLNKERHLVPIFIRDSASYREMIESVKECRRQGMVKQADALKKEILRLTSITDCNVAQMREFIDQVCIEAQQQGIRLPAKDYE